MFPLIRRDFVVTYENKTAFYMLLGIIPLMLFLTDDFDANMAFLYSVLTFMFIGTRTPFAYEAKDKPHLFIQSLPVTKIEIVVSKYIGIFVNFLIGSVFVVIYISILSLLNFIDVKDLNLSTVFITLAIGIVLLSLSLPAEFFFTSKTAHFINLFVYILFLNFFILGNNKILDFINVFSNYKIGIFLLITTIYSVSMGASVLLYKNRNFY